MWIIHKWSLLYIVGTVLVVVDGSEDVISVATDMADSAHFTSLDFPKCCKPYNVTVEVAEDVEHTSLRLFFTDLDLPKGSTLKLYHGTSVHDRTLFREQPAMRYGQWTRPFVHVSRSEKIFIIFVPPLDILWALRVVTALHTYVGFRAEVYNSYEENWDYPKSSSLLCPAVASVMEGGKVLLKSYPSAPYGYTEMDCVWQLKVPPEQIFQEHKYYVYARFLLAKTDWYVQVREGITSQGLLLQEFSDLSRINQTEEGIISDTGLYIRARMLSAGAYYRISFVYGLFYWANGTVFCTFWGRPGFLCEADNWCIPVDNVCNGVSNCPSGQDEWKQSCKDKTDLEEAVILIPPATSLPGKTVVVKPISKTTCPPGLKTCPSGECMRTFDNCVGHRCSLAQRRCVDGSCVDLSKLCPHKCGRHGNKPCPDGSCIKYYLRCNEEKCYADQKMCGNNVCQWANKLCPEDSCPQQETHKCANGESCYNSYDECDDIADCKDFTDENGCSKLRYLWTRPRYLLILIPAIIIMGLLTVGLIRQCRKQCNKEEVEVEDILLDTYKTSLPAMPAPTDLFPQPYPGFDPNNPSDMMSRWKPQSPPPGEVQSAEELLLSPVGDDKPSPEDTIDMNC